jgi:adenylate kinase family enzyme
MRRVFVTGLSGAGKSWLSVRLAAMTGLPSYHVDRLAKPFGRKGQRLVVLDKLRQIQVSDRWIIDGLVYHDTLRWFEAADTIVILDRPLILRLVRVFWRTLSGNYAGRLDDPPLTLIRNLWTIARSARRNRERLFQIRLAMADRADVVVLRTDAEVRAWLSRLGPIPELGPGVSPGSTVL